MNLEVRCVGDSSGDILLATKIHRQHSITRKLTESPHVCLSQSFCLFLLALRRSSTLTLPNNPSHFPNAHSEYNGHQFLTSQHLNWPLNFVTWILGDTQATSKPQIAPSGVTEQAIPLSLNLFLYKTGNGTPDLVCTSVIPTLRRQR